MTIISSLFLGNLGKYRILNINVDFAEQAEGEIFQDIFGKGRFSQLTKKVLSNRFVNIATLGYLHVFIHEMGHAMAAKMLGDSSPEIIVYRKTCQGVVRYTDYFYGKKEILVSIAGPCLASCWETAKLTGSIGLAALFPSFLGITAASLLGSSALFWLFGEMAYLCSREGDWRFLRGSDSSNFV